MARDRLLTVKGRHLDFIAQSVMVPGHEHCRKK
jgi:hypothetical protein